MKTYRFLKGEGAWSGEAPRQGNGTRPGRPENRRRRGSIRRVFDRMKGIYERQNGKNY